MTVSQLEKRVAKLEREVEDLARQRDEFNGQPRNGKWWVEHAGRFANDPVYDEIVRLGRKYRESLRPKPRRKRKQKAAR
jgi:hypothetical protein